MKKVVIGLSLLVAVCGFAMADGTCALHGKFYGGSCPTCYGAAAADIYGNTMTPSEVCKPYDSEYKKTESAVSSINYNKNIKKLENMNKSKDACVDSYNKKQIQNLQQQQNTNTTNTNTTNTNE